MLAFINIIRLKRLRNAIWPCYYYIILKVNSANKGNHTIIYYIKIYKT
jgi:hypothetical protein